MRGGRRSFSKYLPWTAMLPYADLLNHTNTATTYCFTDGTVRMKTSPTHGYQAGDEVFNFYGNRTNRFLLSHYGFALSENACDVLRATITFSSDGADSELRKLTFELSANAPCVALLVACVVVLRPVKPDHQGGNHHFDAEAVKLAADCIEHMENTFPTTLAADATLLSDRACSLRHTFALHYRMGPKRILAKQKDWIVQLQHFIERCRSPMMSVDDVLDAYLQVCCMFLDEFRRCAQRAFASEEMDIPLTVVCNLCRKLASRRRRIVSSTRSTVRDSWNCLRRCCGTGHPGMWQH